MKDMLLELAGRCKAATDGSRELDGLIACSDPEQGEFRSKPQTDGDYFDGVAWGWVTAPAYTSSIDDALTLVPEGWVWTAGRHETGCGLAYLHNGERHFVGIGTRPNPARRHAEVRAATPALALCAAALRARAALIEDATTQPHDALSRMGGEGDGV